jgi:hypothetical protein
LVALLSPGIDVVMSVPNLVIFLKVLQFSSMKNKVYSVCCYFGIIGV